MARVQSRSQTFFRLGPAGPGKAKGFAVRRGDIQARADATFASNLGLITSRYARPQFPLVPLGSIANLIQYGTSERAHLEPMGLPVLRIPNLQADGWDLSELKYMEVSDEELVTYRLAKGDILFNRTNGSKDLVGKCEVFDFDGDYVFASYLIRLRLDEKRAVPRFVAYFLNTPSGRGQVEHSARQMLQSNINTEEIRALQIPLPDIAKQRDLVATMDAAREVRWRKLAEATQLIQGLDSYLMTSLGITPLPGSIRKSFAVRARDLRGNRLDPPAHRPAFASDQRPRTPPRPLRELAWIDCHETPKPDSEETEVAYCGLPECDQTEVRKVVMRPYSEVKGRGVTRPGDILFARIEPSVFNKKYVYVEDLKGHPAAFTSTEFYVVTPRKEVVDPHFLYAMFFSSFVYEQTKGKTTGSSGRRRLDPELFAGLQIPVPERDEQERIASEVRRRRDEARRLRSEAESGWEAAKRMFEDALLGPTPP